MANVLHIVRMATDHKAIESIKAHAKEENVSLLLIQDERHTKPVDTIQTFVLREEENKNMNSDTVRTIGYEEMVQFLFEYDRIVVW